MITKLCCIIVIASCPDLVRKNQKGVWARTYLEMDDKDTPLYFSVDVYGKHLVILERVITESESLGSVVIVGDFNAHLGKLGGSRGLGDPNVQGVLLHDLLDRCELNVVSLGSLSSGETYTYRSGSTTTTVDYVLMDLMSYH